MLCHLFCYFLPILKTSLVCIDEVLSKMVSGSQCVISGAGTALSDDVIRPASCVKVGRHTIDGVFFDNVQRRERCLQEFLRV